jgi:glyoxylase-like metal-dependent hydrolase (beta-lactamase superfamily II)
MNIHQFTFGPFQENTFILFDETKECVIIDPGCASSSEQQELKQFIESEKLKVKHLLNTHCHVDHIA